MRYINYHSISRSVSPAGTALLVLVAGLAAFPAQAKGPKAGAQYKLPPIAKTTLADSAHGHKWTRDDVHDFCTGKYAGNDYERHSCIKTYAKEVGHDMIPGDQQALESYRKATAGVQKSKANRKDPADKQAPQDTGTVQQAPPLSDHYSINDVPPTHR